MDVRGEMAASRDLDVRLAQLHESLAAYRYMHDYYGYLTECLGYDFWQIREPRVQRTLSRVGQTVLDWIENRPYQRVRRKAMYIRPRGTVKSGGVAEPLPTFVHLHDKNIAMAVMSAKEDMALKFSRATRGIWMGEGEANKLQALYGNFYAPGRKWSDSEMVTSWRSNNRGDPTLKCYSVRQGATSGHFDLFIMDDPTTAEAIRDNQDWNDRVIDQYLRLKAVTNRDSLFVLICTRYGDDDLVGYVIENEIKPAVKRVFNRIPEDFEEHWYRYGKYAGWEIDFDDVAHVASDEEVASGAAVEVEGLQGQWVLHYPEIWSKEMLEDVLQDPSKGQLFFWEQLMNRPHKREDNPIKKHHIEACQIDMTQVPAGAFQHMTMHCDTAWKDEDNYLRQRGDWNVIQIWGHHEGHVYLLWQWHGRVMQDQFGEAFVRGLQWAKGFQLMDPTTRRYERVGHPVRLLTYDKPTGGQGTSSKNWFFRTAANAGERCPPIIEIPRHTKKVSAILNVVGYWQDGRVHVVRDLMGNEELFREMMYIGYTGHRDDHADAAKDVFHPDVYRPGRVLDVSAFEESSRGRRSVPVAHGHVGPDGSWVPARGGNTPGKARLRQILRERR